MHDLNLAATFAHHVVLLKGGRVLVSGDRTLVFTKEHIKTAYQLEPLIYHEKGIMHLFFR